MEQLQPMKEVLMSWRRCMDMGIESKSLEPALCVKDELLELKQRGNSMQISVFIDCSSKINLLITNKHPLLLINSEGILLKISKGKHQKKNIQIVEGAIFTEESSGTNAIAMSIKLKKPVLTFQSYHYCEFLRKFHLYSVPLLVNEEVVGYLAMIISEQEIISELIAITELLSYQIVNELKIRSNLAAVRVDSSLKLSPKQLVVLQLLARGMTDKAIAIDTGLCFATIRYHKKNIFKKMGVSCSIEAVIKALKLNLLLLDEIVI